MKVKPLEESSLSYFPNKTIFLLYHVFGFLQLVRPSKSKLSDGVDALEKLASEQGKLLTELEEDMAHIKEGLPYMWKINKLRLKFKKDKAFSDGGETWVNKEDKLENGDNDGHRFDKDKEES